MNREDIIRMAREAGLNLRGHYDEPGSTPQELERFAALVTAAERDRLEPTFERLETLMEIREGQPNKPCCLAEREACAKVCDFEVARLTAIDEPRPALAVGICAAAIRARSNT